MIHHFLTLCCRIAGRLPLYEWHITLLRSLWNSLPS